MLVGVDDVTSRSVGASETGKHKNSRFMNIRKKRGGDGRNQKKLTGGLCACQRLTLLVVANSIDVYQILCFRLQSSQSEIVPGWRQPLILCSTAARLLMANTVSSDGRGWSHPVNSEGVGTNVREVQTSGRIQSWKTGENTCICFKYKQYV